MLRSLEGVPTFWQALLPPFAEQNEQGSTGTVYSGTYVRSLNVTFFNFLFLTYSFQTNITIQTIHHWCKNLALPRSQTCRKFHYSQ